jgi:hypothetical protein
MTRLYSYNGATKAVPAGSNTLVWGPSEIPGDGVVAFLVGGAGVGSELGPADLKRFRVKADGDVIVEYTAAQLASFVNAFSPAHPTFTLGTTVSFPIPLNLLDAPTMAGADVCQFPMGKRPTVEIDTADVIGGGTVTLGWIQSTVTPRMQPLVTTRTMNIAAGPSTNNRFPLDQRGLVRGICMDATGVDRLQVFLGGRPVLNLPGSGGDLILAAQRLDGAPNAIGQDPFYFKPDWMLPASQNGGSYLLLDVDGTWPGVAEEVSIFSVMKQGDG